MATQHELDIVYMDMAISMSSISKGKRAQVGAIAVTQNGVVITGVNGLPKQLGNELEYEEVNLISVFGQSPYIERTGKLITKPTVIHAENAILVKCAREGVSMLNSVVYTSLSPCEHCASMLVSAGVSRVVYYEQYRCLKGLEVLKQCGVIVEQLNVDGVK